MKISLSTLCKECYQESKKKGQKYKAPSEPTTLVELNEKGLYKIICPSGHIKWIFIEEQLFQILYDLGALSLSDGYTREAVSSFSTSLERFYEFIIKFVLLKDHVENKFIEKYMNLINRQSERQLGGFYALYIEEFKETPPILENKWVEFRNEVTHLGIIPNEAKTFEYGQVIANIIFDILIKLKKKYKTKIYSLINKVTFYNYDIVNKGNPLTKNLTILSFPRLIQLRIINYEYFEKIDLRNEIKKYKRGSDIKRISYYQ